jgi:hypothetical protein
MDGGIIHAMLEKTVPGFRGWRFESEEERSADKGRSIVIDLPGTLSQVETDRSIARLRREKEVSAVIVPQKASSRKSAPLLKKVAYAAAIPAESQALLDESLSRRKTAWTRQLAAMGVELAGPVQPELKVTASRDTLKGEKVEFTLEWNQGELRVGSFKAFVTRKNLNPDLRRMPAPPVSDEKKLLLRFKKTVLADVAGINIESEVSMAEIKAFLDQRGLRLISEDQYNGIVIAAVTGADVAEAVARDINAKGILLSAKPFTYSAPEERQILLVFKKTTVVDAGVKTEVEVSDTDKAELLAGLGLTVLEISRQGEWLVAVAPGASADAASQALSRSRLVRHAYASLADAPESRQVVLTFRESAVDDDAVAGVLTSRGIKVLEFLGERFYRVAAPEGMTGKDLAADLAKASAVEAAVAVGSVSDADIEASARGVASYKGRPWSSTEYNMNYYYAEMSLVARGATKAQLEAFRKLCDEAPVRGGGFNPWSGD